MGDPEDLLCDFEAFEHNNKADDESRIATLTLFIDTQCQKNKHDRDKKRYQEIVKAACKNLSMKFQKENEKIRGELKTCKKNISSMSTKLNSVESELYSLKKKIPQMKQEIVDLKKANVDMERLRRQVQSIQNQVTTLARRPSYTGPAEPKPKRTSATFRNETVASANRKRLSLDKRERLKKKENEKAKAEKNQKPKPSGRAAKLLKSTNSVMAKPKKEALLTC